MRQTQFRKTKWKHRFSHGGCLRSLRAGRRERPLSTRDPIHLVFKANHERLRGGFRLHRRFALAHAILRKYATRFFVKIEQVTFQGDHIHVVVRITRRSGFQNFLRVFSGQIAQRFEQEGLLTTEPRPARRPGSESKVTDTPAGDLKRGVTGTPGNQKRLWKFRPFTRVVRGYKAYRTLRDYVQLNEQEAAGLIPYRKERLKGLSAGEWEILWS